MELSSRLIETQVAAALAEDLGLAGDITSNAIFSAKHEAQGVIRAREAGVLAGMDFACEAFRQCGAIEMSDMVSDGTVLKSNMDVMTLCGDARVLLAAERVALNFLGHLSGVASATAALVRAVAGTRAIICDTRKTTPGLRAAEKYAVVMGGGANHRFGLFDAILIKDNHIAIAGCVSQAVRTARSHATHVQKIEVEIDALAQIEPALEAGADILLLDNMLPAQLSEAVGLIGGRAQTEASGRVSLETIAELAASGVDYISVGRITHSAPCLDLGLDIIT